MTNDRDRGPFTDDEVSALLRTVDHPVPRVDASAILGRARRRARAAVWTRRVAVVALLAGTAGIAVAMPGSPVRLWLESAFDRSDDSAPSEAAPAPVTPSATAGVAVDPGDDLVVRIDVPPGGARLSVSLSDEAQVTASSAAGSAGFATGEGTLTVDVRTAGTLVELGIPRTAARVRVLSRDRLLFESRAGVVRGAAGTSVPLEIELDR